MIYGSMTSSGKIATPIRLTTRDGCVAKKIGRVGVSRLRATVDDADAGGTTIAECSNGTVSRGRVTGHKDDKLVSLAHIALGYNMTRGACQGCSKVRCGPQNALAPLPLLARAVGFRS
jgi:hypothetical protein